MAVQFRESPYWEIFADAAGIMKRHYPVECTRAYAEEAARDYLALEQKYKDDPRGEFAMNLITSAYMELSDLYAAQLTEEQAEFRSNSERQRQP